jgi:hypothetical protein
MTSKPKEGFWPQDAHKTQKDFFCASCAFCGYSMNRIALHLSVSARAAKNRFP